MPRNDDPSAITSRHGRALEDSVESSALTFPLSEVGGGAAVGAHLTDPLDAHNASAISTEEERATAGVDPLYDGDDVQEALDELAALLPQPPATIGNGGINTGVPYWGALNVSDPPDDSHPEYRTSASFGGTGIETSTYPYGGTAEAATGKVGGFTRGGEVIETFQIVSSGAGTATLDCMVYPADRGVLALIKFDKGGSLPAAPANRVISALLLGQGVTANDGEPGGMFQEENAEDLFGFPGRATGQFDLDEIHNGVNAYNPPNPPAAAIPLAGQTRQEALLVVPNRLGAKVGFGGTSASNFFGYRMPYLDSYAPGLFALAAEGHAAEEPRYFDDPDAVPALATAGAYSDYTHNFFTYQLARFREVITLPGATDDFGSIVLMHFKTEAAFEALVLSGTLPTQAALYSLVPTLTGPDGAEDVLNTTVPTIRRALFVDGGVTPPATVTGEFDNLGGGTTTMLQVSGAFYYASARFESTLAGPIPHGLSSADLFLDSFRTGEVAVGGEVTTGLENAVPLQLNVRHLGDDGDGATQGLKVSPLNVGASGLDANGVAPFSYAQFVDTAFNLIAPPAIGASATQVLLVVQRFATHVGSPVFFENAQLRVWMRDPLGENAFPGTALTFMGDTGAATGDVSLMVNFDKSFGLEDSVKDAAEAFQDEIYRLDANFAAGGSSLSLAERGSLLGPGVVGPGGHNGFPISLHVRVDTEDATLAYDPTAALDNTVPGPGVELQVRGLPDWFHSNAISPLPPTPYAVPHGGHLSYPQVDYTTLPPAVGSFRPNTNAPAPENGTANQPDYSTLTGDRVYIRSFDVGVAGKTLMIFRIVGCALKDFGFIAPGPGDFTGTGLSIQFKIPGVTTWMDGGRPDGDGPSKQSPFLDGAGCLVLDEDTFDITGGDPDGTNLKACQIKINVGPAAATFPVPEVAGAPTVRYPVMMKIAMRDPASPVTTPDFRQSGEPVTSPAAVTGVKSVTYLP